MRLRVTDPWCNSIILYFDSPVSLRLAEIYYNNRHYTTERLSHGA